MGSLPLSPDLLADVSDAYRAGLADALDSDSQVQRARDQWAAFVRSTQGDVFADLDGADPESVVSRTFRDSLTFHFLVAAMLDAVESETGVTLSNRDPGENTAVDVDLGACHDRVRSATDGRDRLAAAVSADSLRQFSPADLRDCYHSVIGRDRRLALGEYFTPRGVADLAVADIDPIGRVLDPGCGTGVFLTACLDRTRTALETGDTADPDDVIDTCTSAVVGFDCNPIAVSASKLSYCCALFDELVATDRDAVELPVFLTDSLALDRDWTPQFRGSELDTTFDTLVGNPPWIPWQRVPDRVKQGLEEQYVAELGLQPHSGMDARLGHSNDDLSIPFVWVCIHRYLREGGQARFVLKRDSMRGPAGAVLRRLRVSDRELALRRVQDFSAVDPFPAVGANVAVYSFVADRDHSFPIPTTVWTESDGTTPAYQSLSRLRRTLDSEETELRPLDPDEQTSAWVRGDAERGALGECAHEIRHGLKDDASAVFGLDRADLDAVDTDLVYPYLRSRHVRKYGLTGHDLRLVPMETAGEDNEAWLRDTYPKTHEFLRGHRERLAERSSSWLDSGPFYSVFGLGEYTWAPYKVVWCRLGFKPDFAVASTREDPDLGERVVVPGDHYMFISCADAETAHALCALLNSAPYQRTLRDITSDGKASLSKSVVSKLALPEPAAIDNREQLAQLSMRAHAVVDEDLHEGNSTPDHLPALASVQSEIDRLVTASLTDAAEAARSRPDSRG